MPAVEQLDDIDVLLLEAEAQAKAREDLEAFTLYTMPTYRVNWHHRIIFRAVTRWMFGLSLRTIICAPPQTGKSQIVSREAPAFLLGKNPEAKIICGSYSADLAEEMATDVHNIVASQEYRELFPHIRMGSEATKREGKVKERQNVWGLAGHRGGLKAVGRGGGVSGFSAEYAIIDDPIKGREEASSKAIRDKCWDWLQDEILMRLGASGACLIMHTRWDEDDMVGRIKRRMKEDPESERWDIIELPARLDELPAHPEDRRAIGDPLWDWYYAGKKDNLSPAEQREEAKSFLKRWEKRNKFGFSSLAQQRPVPKGSRLFPIERITIVKAVSEKRVRTVRYWDNAGTKDAGCYTAGGKVSKLANGQFLIEHMERGQWESIEREARKKATAKRDGVHCRVYIEQEPGSSGKDVANQSIRNMAGRIVEADKVTGSKELRAEIFATQVQAGNVLMLEGTWNQDLLDELDTWPRGLFKDQGDALAGAFSKIVGDTYQLFVGK